MIRILIAGFFFLWIVMSILPIRILLNQKEQASDYQAQLSAEQFFGAKRLNAANTQSNDFDKRVEAALDLADVYWRKEKYNDAHTLYSNVWQERSALDLPYDAKLTKAMFGLAGVHRDMGSLDTSEKSYEDLYNYERTRLGPDDKRVIRDINNLGLIYYLRGKGTPDKEARERKWEESVKLLREALEKEKQVYGPDSQRVSATLSTLSFVLRDLGRKDESKVALEESLAISSKVKRSTTVLY